MKELVQEYLAACYFRSIGENDLSWEWNNQIQPKLYGSSRRGYNGRIYDEEAVPVEMEKIEV